MGGEWGVGASLTMETIPARTRGIISGLLQAGYPSGYLLAAVLYGTSYHFLGWRGMFMAGALPAFLVLFIRRNVEESPAWKQHKAQPGRMGATIKGRWKLFVYVVILMTAFNSFSHGTQDIYPTFLQVQHKFGPEVVSTIAIFNRLRVKSLDRSSRFLYMQASESSLHEMSHLLPCACFPSTVAIGARPELTYRNNRLSDYIFYE